MGEEATRLLADANVLLDEFEAEGSLTPRGVAGIWPACSTGDDVELFARPDRDQPIATFHMLRQQNAKTPGKPNRSLADFVAPADAGVEDYLGAFVVSIHGVDDIAAGFRAEHDDYRAIMTQALGDRLAEAFAEWLHERVRKDLWGYAPDESFSSDDLVRERYRGIRPAPGYPSQPDHTEKITLFYLLDAEANAGAGLTESLAMTPPSTVSGLYLAHPQADYFNLGPVGTDQVEDYARRKGIAVEEVERWLAPTLGYEPPPPAPSGDGVAAGLGKVVGSRG
jgi:5-methyltetrahydrofolate--homocysteine methyltransferase